MSATEHYGFPIMDDTPPEGTTGKNLRDMIVGASENSFAQKADKAIKEAEDKIPTKTSQLENDSKFLAPDAAKNLLIIGPDTGVDYWGYWDYSTTTTGALCAQETIKCVQTELAMTTPNIVESICEWDGDTSGKTALLNLMYKISSNTIAPDKILAEVSNTTASRVLAKSFISKDSSLETLKLYLYLSNGSPVAAIATESGSIPASIIEQMMGVNPGADVPFEAGTYLIKQDTAFISKISSVISVKDYIDQKIGS